MTASPSRVGILTDGDLSEEQRAAADWLAARDGIAVERVAFDDLVATVSEPSASTGTTGTTPNESYPGPGVGDRGPRTDPLRRFDALWWHRAAPLAGSDPLADAAGARSEERRVGKECTIQCRSRWSPYH